MLGLRQKNQAGLLGGGNIASPESAEYIVGLLRLRGCFDSITLRPILQLRRPHSPGPIGVCDRGRANSIHRVAAKTFSPKFEGCVSISDAGAQAKEPGWTFRRG